MKEIIFLNGKFILPEQAKVSVLSPGFLYGWGLFETMRSYHDKIIYFDEHLIRIKDSSKLIGMKFTPLEIRRQRPLNAPPLAGLSLTGFSYSTSKLKQIIKQAVKLSGFPDAYVRLTLWKSDSGIDTLIIARKYRPYPKAIYKHGFCAGISSFRQNEDSFLTQLKTMNYLLYQLSYLQAQDKRFDESIILNTRGYISEASRSNIFFIQDNQLFTPCLECGCLRGITRKVIFDLAKKYSIPLNEGKFRPDDLYNSDEAFLTNSLMGVMPLTSIENRIIGKGESGRLTRFFIRKYNSLLEDTVQ